VTVCSQCGVPKGQTNHWFLAWVERNSRFCFDLFGADPALQREETVQKLCGEACLLKAAQRHAEFLRITQ